jgi:hypothetical protein
MKKFIVGALLASLSAPAAAHGYYGGYDYIVPLIMGGIAGYSIRAAQQPPIAVVQPAPVVVQQQVVQPAQVYVYPSNAPTPLGMTCNLQSVYVNGMVVTNKYCY